MKVAKQIFSNKKMLISECHVTAKKNNINT